MARQHNLGIFAITTKSMADRYIYAAIKKNNFERVEQLIRLPGYDINKMWKQVTPLMLAAYLGFTEIVKVLIENGADVNFQDHEGRTALLHTIEKKPKTSAIIVELLIKAGCDLNITMVSGEQAMHSAACHGNIVVLDILCRAGLPVNKPAIPIGYTPLQLAVLSGEDKSVNLLLKFGADPNIATSEEETPLHFAAMGSCDKMIQKLIQSGSEINRLNCLGESPFSVAIQESNVDIAKQLYFLGSVMEECTLYSPLSVACRENNSGMVNYLLSEGYNVSKDDTLQYYQYVTFEEEHPELFSILRHRETNPLSLKECLRVFLRKSLKGSQSEISCLPLPRTLSEWVSKDHIY